MKSVLCAVLISTLSLTSVSALTINKVRDAYTPPSYSVGITTSDGQAVNIPSNSGVVFQTFNPAAGPFVTHIEIDNDPAALATCVARDQFGNQVRAFGGPNFGGVEAVDFVPADGKQIFSLSCFPA